MKKARAVITLLTLLAAPAGGLVEGQTKSSFPGHWIGSIEVQGMQLRMLFHVTESDGAFMTTMVSVDQGNAEIPVESTNIDDRTLSLAMPAIGGSYEGTLSADGGTIEGSFTQMGNTLPLVLSRTTEEAAAVKRPQDPEPPFPYTAEDVVYTNEDGGHTLAGTFTKPTGEGPFPAVVLISGSGPQDRDEALLGHRPFLVLADHLTRSGIAVLRFDDRGVGKSTGNFATATSRDFASDVRAGVSFLKGRADVDARNIGLAGHSEGGLIAPLVAADSDDVAFIVLMAGPGVTGERILYAQQALILAANGASPEAIDRSRVQQEAMYAILKSEQDPTDAATRLGDLMRRQFEEATDEEKAQAGISDEASLDRAVVSSIAQLNSPWFRFFLTYDPATALQRVRVPVLAINGEKDLQVPYEENLREIGAALERGGNGDYELHALPDLNHLFQHAETGSPSEYQGIEETFSVATMELIANWILGTFRN